MQFKIKNNFGRNKKRMCIGLNRVIKFWMTKTLDFQNGSLKVELTFHTTALTDTSKKGGENSRLFTQLVIIPGQKKLILTINC